MSNLCIYVILALVLYLIFYKNKEFMDDTSRSLRDKLLKKDTDKKLKKDADDKLKKKEMIKIKFQKKLKANHQKNLDLIKEVTNITKELDDGMREIDSW